MCHLKSPHSSVHAWMIADERLRNGLMTMVNVCFLCEQLKCVIKMQNLTKVIFKSGC